MTAALLSIATDILRAVALLVLGAFLYGVVALAREAILGGLGE